jgi:acyl carrier protein
LGATEKLEFSFRQGLALPATSDVSSVESNTTQQWDSVAHLQLVVAIEDEFGIQLDPADVVDLKSYASAVTILQRHGVWVSG